MKFDRQHIEDYLIEYFEGNLSPSEIDALLHFISTHQEYHEMFEQYKQTYVKPTDPMPTFNKEKLKKSSHDAIINEWEDACIRYFEGELTEKEKQQVEKEIQHDEAKKKIFDDYVRTYLLAEEIKFAHKERLKKNNSWQETMELLCIKHIEMELSENERILLNQWLESDDEANILLLLYENTKLKPDTNQQYHYKEFLKKQADFRSQKISMLWTVVAAAAAVLIGFLLWMPVNAPKQPISVVAQSKQTYNVKRTIYYSIAKYQNKKTVKTPIIQTQQILPAEKNSVPEQILLVQNQEEDKMNEQFADNTTFSETQITETTPLTTEGLNELFANNRLNYFHEMIEKSLQQGANNVEKNFSWWKTLENGAKYVQEYTGVPVIIQEHDQQQMVKREIAIGNFSFSRTTKK